MELSEEYQQIVQYLQDPSKSPRPANDKDKRFAYLLTYIGELHVQGYRSI